MRARATKTKYLSVCKKGSAAKGGHHEYLQSKFQDSDTGLGHAQLDKVAVRQARGCRRTIK